MGPPGHRKGRKMAPGSVDRFEQNCQESVHGKQSALKPHLVSLHHKSSNAASYNYCTPVPHFCLALWCFFFPGVHLSILCIPSLAIKVPTWSTVFGARLPHLHGLKQGKTSALPEPRRVIKEDSKSWLHSHSNHNPAAKLT